MTDRNQFIASLPASDQAEIVARLYTKLDSEGYTAQEIAEATVNVLDERVCNVMDDDGTFYE